MTTLPSAISISPESNLQLPAEYAVFPMLEKEQEYMSPKMASITIPTAHQMVTSHLRLVSGASGYRNMVCRSPN